MIASVKGNGRFPRGTLLDSSGEVLFNHAPDIENIGIFPFGSGTGYSHYGANVQKNSLIGWLYRGGDADADIGANVQILRERSRDAFMGIPLAAGAIETLDTNVVGEGLYPAPAVDADALGITFDEAAALNKELAMKFNWWANDPREADFEAKDTFYTKQSVVFQSALLSGDCPVLFPLKPRDGTLFDFRLRVLEADRIRNPMFFDPNINIVNGVELSQDGELAAYHICEVHPLAQQFTQQLSFPANIGKTFRVQPYGAASGRRNMVLVMRPERPEQRRGVPIMSVCLELLKQQGRYVDATVIGAVIQSYFTAFVTSDFPDPTIFESLLTDQQKAQIFNLNSYDVQLGPGVVNFMRPGHEVKFATPTQPMSSFGDFVIAVAQFIGAATGIPYEVLLKRYNSSYSASRAALLDFWKRVRKWRRLLVESFCQPIYEEWMQDAMDHGEIKLFKGNFDDPYIRRAMLRCIWTGSSQGSLDPQKEVAAADLRVKCGFSTIERESMELNASNWRENMTQGANEKKEFEAAGLTYPPYRPNTNVPLTGHQGTPPV